MQIRKRSRKGKSPERTASERAKPPRGRSAEKSSRGAIRELHAGHHMAPRQAVTSGRRSGRNSAAGRQTRRASEARTR
jgi:hypothetical protein